MKDQKVAILNAISKISTPKMAEPITDHIIDVGLDAITVESLTDIEDVSEAAATRVVAAIDIHKLIMSAEVRKQSEPKPTAAEKFRQSNGLEDRVEIGRRVAEMRLNSFGGKPASWRSIRAKLGLRNDEFHKVIRLEDHFKESCVERIESFEDGWGYKGKLEVLLGFVPEGSILERIEACKPKTAKKEESKPETKVVENEESSVEPEITKTESIEVKSAEATEHTEPEEAQEEEAQEEVVREIDLSDLDGPTPDELAAIEAAQV